MSSGIRAQWECLESLKFEETVLTPLEILSLNRNVSFPILIQPNSLSPGYTYTFRLTAKYSELNFISEAKITITINLPPYGGALSIIPDQGITFNTTFTISTYLWMDSDLPLNYIFFAYLFDNSDRILLQAASTSPTTYSHLPQGTEYGRYFITCITEAIDSFGASSSEVQSIKVSPLTSLNYSRLLVETTEQLDSAYTHYDVNRVYQIISTVLVSMSMSVCIYAPNCIILNRFPCAYILNTCGECYPDYFGVVGPSNSACRSKSSVSISFLPMKLNAKKSSFDDSVNLQNTLLFSADGEYCLYSFDCASNVCDRNRCKPIFKSCSCLNNGICNNYDYNRKLIDICPAQDAYCFKECNCSTQYTGRDCSVSSFELETIDKLKRNFCAKLKLTFDRIEPTVYNIQSILSNFASILNDNILLSTDTINFCLSTVSSWMQRADVKSLKFDLSFYTSIFLAFTKLYSFDTTIINANVLYQLTSAYQSIILKGFDALVVNQAPIYFTTENIRICILKIALNQNNSSFSSPLSMLEQIYEKTSIKVSFALDDLDLNKDSDYLIDLALTVHNRIRYNRLFLSPLFEIAVFNYYNFTDQKNLSMILDVPNLYSYNYSLSDSVKGEVECIRKYESYNISVCSGLENKTIICDGKSNLKIKYSCPGYQTYPVCLRSRNLIDWDNKDCIVTNYDSTHSVCECNLSFSGAEDFQNLFHFVEINERFNNFSTISINLDPRDRNPGIPLYTIGFIFVGIIFIGFITFFYEMKSVDKVSNLKRINDQNSFKSYFDKTLPIELSELNILKRFNKLLLRSNPLSAILFNDHFSEYRSFRIFELVARFLISCLVD